MSDLSLYEISPTLVKLMQLRDATAEMQLEDGLTAEDRAAALAGVDQEIKELLIADLRDGKEIHGYLRHSESQLQSSKTEIIRLTRYQRVWERRLAFMEQLAMLLLREFVPPDKKGRIRLEGPTGSLAIVGNGGVLPLVIDQPELVPDEYCRMVGWVTTDLWAEVLKVMSFYERYEDRIPHTQLKLDRVPSNEMIRAALELPCGTCDGLKCILQTCPICKGVDEEPCKTCKSKGEIVVACAACGGDGKNRVPGCHFAARGESLRVR